jgi:hypothetical protein
VKRQIIKTRPRAPYLVARVVILIIVIAAVALLAYVLAHHVHAAHTGVPTPSGRTSFLPDEVAMALLPTSR